MDQLDLLKLDVETYRASARAALRRLGLKDVAWSVCMAPDLVGKHFRKWSPRHHPSAEEGFVLLKDEPHAREVAALHNWELVRKPVQEPADALRELEARAAKGFVSADELRQVLARTRLPKDEPAVETTSLREVRR